MTRWDWIHLGMLWLLALGSFFFLLSRKENVYEPSLGITVKLADKRRKVLFGGLMYIENRADAMRDRGITRPVGVTVPAFGRGAVALFWKSLLTRYRVSHGQLLFTVMAPAVIVFIVKRFVADNWALSRTPILLLYVVWMISLTMQSELRTELRQANIVKPMPIAAWKVMLAQFVAGTLHLTGGVLVFAGAMWVMIPQARGELLTACTVGSPFLGFASMAATSIPALMYPDSRDAAQNYLCAMVSFILVFLCIVPTVVLSIAICYSLSRPLYAALAVVSAANLAVGAAATSIAGYAFRRFDPTTE